MNFIEKYLDAFPYLAPWVAQDNETIFYLKEEISGERYLYALDLNKSLKLDEGYIVSKENFAKRSYMPVHFFKDKGKLLIKSDDDNKENFNYYWLDLSSGELEQLTFAKYCGVGDVRPDQKVLIFGDRYKINAGKYSTKIYTLNLESGEQVEILDDDKWSYRLGWSNVKFNESFDKIYLRVDKDNGRKFNNILEFDLNTKKCRHILPKELECSGIWILNNEVYENDLYFTSDLDGNENIYHCNLQSSQIEKVTDYHVKNNGIHIFPNTQKVVSSLAYLDKDYTEVHIFELDGAHKKNEIVEKMNGNFFLSSARETVWFNKTVIDSPSVLVEYSFDDSTIDINREIQIFCGPKDDLVHNHYRFVTYPTFDGHDVRAFLSLPKGKLNAALITSFYGGSNHYYYFTQILSELGIAHLSPAVRGSQHYEKEWQDKIKGDLGGDEILDVLWGAKFLEKELNLTSDKIGVMGGSHGGYATLRCMTMPENFKGKDSTYPFGFGLCWAGFADLEDFYHTSNIPDWLVDILAPYEGNEALYRERSPIHYFDNLSAPLFVCHGRNDARVSATSMEGFIDKLKNSNKDYVLHMIDGAGHSNAGRENKLKEYQVVVKFLKDIIGRC